MLVVADDPAASRFRGSRDDTVRFAWMGFEVTGSSSSSSSSSSKVGTIMEAWGCGILVWRTASSDDDWGFQTQSIKSNPWPLPLL